MSVQNFVLSLGELYGNINRFKLSLRDFLIQLKEFSGDDAELFLEEKETEAQKKVEEDRSAAMCIPFYKFKYSLVQSLILPLL